MGLSERTERALEICLDAVVAPALWPRALQSLGESLGAASCTFCSQELQQLSSRVMPISEEHGAFAELWMRNEEFAPDPHFVLDRYGRKSGCATVVEDQISTAEDRRTQAYYQETARPADRDWWAMCCFPVEGRPWGLVLYRGLRHGPFTLSEAAHLAAVGPRIGRIVGLAEKFANSHLTSELVTLEQANCAALLIDARGRVTNANRLAQALFGPDIAMVRGRLVAAHAISNARLQRLISATTMTKKDNAAGIAPVVLDRDSMPWLLVEAMPVTAFGNNLFVAGHAILLLTDLTSPPRPDPTTLRIAFGLTPAEARLAARLAAGKGLEETATRLGITRATACSQLKAVFEKTNTRRQTELIGLIAHLGPFGGSRWSRRG
jgi:DNA-binding CsgD family transcriptional regulator